MPWLSRDLNQPACQSSCDCLSTLMSCKFYKFCTFNIGIDFNWLVHLVMKVIDNPSTLSSLVMRANDEHVFLWCEGRGRERCDSYVSSNWGLVDHWYLYSSEVIIHSFSPCSWSINEDEKFTEKRGKTSWYRKKILWPPSHSRGGVRSVEFSLTAFRFANCIVYSIMVVTCCIFIDRSTNGMRVTLKQYLAQGKFDQTISGRICWRRFISIIRQLWLRGSVKVMDKHIDF